ncbi:MAG: hypothetical protein WC812_02110 [Candidatus Pacearchaeota archaeon]|jgi:hypothetical protein
MTKPELKAYIFPEIKVGNEVKTLILKSDLGAMISARESCLGKGYLLTGEMKIIYPNSFLGKIFGKMNYITYAEFINDVENNFENCDVSSLEEKIEEFSKEKGLDCTKLIFI